MSSRVRVLVDAPPSAEGSFVLYWMIGARRASWNFALDHAIDWARTLGKPVLVLEALRCDYRWASDRLHRFVIDGMRDNRAAFDAMGLGYYPYLEEAPKAGRGLLRALAARAAVVVTDRAPVFDLPRLVVAAAKQVRVRFEDVDSNGLIPLDDAPAETVFPSAYAFRRYAQHALPRYLLDLPRARPLDGATLPPPPEIPGEVTARWPCADLDRASAMVASLPIDHGVRPGTLAGGSRHARDRLTTFVRHLDHYESQRNHPDEEAGSGLSPFLHFGHISAHEVATRVLERDAWTPERLSARTSGAKAGWWGTSSCVEAFLDQLVIWRELGFNMSARRTDVDDYESLPQWARTTLERHADDARPYLYTLQQFATATTHDPLWNAAHRQLVDEGRMHNYLRMLWGKKILEWTPSPREALAVMIELNNRFALDGRDPNSSSGIFWVLGRYDRPWPERPIFGSVRCMTSASTARKLHVKRYLERYGPSSDEVAASERSRARRDRLAVL